MPQLSSLELSQGGQQLGASRILDTPIIFTRAGLDGGQWQASRNVSHVAGVLIIVCVVALFVCLYVCLFVCLFAR